jgi:hypothetical protein
VGGDGDGLVVPHRAGRDDASADVPALDAVSAPIVPARTEIVANMSVRPVSCRHLSASRLNSEVARLAATNALPEAAFMTLDRLLVGWAKAPVATSRSSAKSFSGEKTVPTSEVLRLSTLRAVAR